VSSVERAYYVTTPIYYINGNPHVGHVYTTIVADALARTARTFRPAFFLTGTDEHGQKVANAAAAAGMSPQVWTDELVPRWQELFKLYHCSYDDFIRTTQARHVEKVQRVFEQLHARGDVYLGKYEGWYCVHEETFWLESKLVDGRCPTCGREVQWISEDDWFFRLSAYRERLIEHYQRNPTWVQPRSVYNEMMALLRDGLEDLSISRATFDWGVSIPRHGGVIYVWLDALLNYITAIGWSEDDALFNTYWPASTQLIGKDIARFHAIIWPAILWALGEAAPDLIFAHGWITVEGQKMSKSVGNVADPFALAQRFGADSVRYFLLREAAFGSDFSYSEEKISARYTSDLANDLGNLLQRTLAMVQRYFGGTIPAAPAESDLEHRFGGLAVKVRAELLELRFRDALESIWDLVATLNRRIDERKPWVLQKEGRRDELGSLLYDCCEGLRRLAILLHPVMPERTAEMWRQLGKPGLIDEDWSTSFAGWGRIAAGTRVSPGSSLFPKIA